MSCFDQTYILCTCYKAVVRCIQRIYISIMTGVDRHTFNINSCSHSHPLGPQCIGFSTLGPSLDPHLLSRLYRPLQTYYDLPLSKILSSPLCWHISRTLAGRVLDWDNCPSYNKNALVGLLTYSHTQIPPHSLPFITQFAYDLKSLSSMNMCNKLTKVHAIIILLLILCHTPDIYLYISDIYK